MITESIQGQIVIFCLTVGVGALLGLLFDVYRVVRGRLRPGALATAAGDLLFWLVATVVTFALLIVGNWGELRLYVWVGFLSGAFAYRFLASRVVIRLLVGLAMALERAAGAVAARSARLVRLPGEWGRRIWWRTRFGQVLQRSWRWIRGGPGANGNPPAA